MQTTTLALGLSHLLVGVVARQWTVAAYTGLQCNGEQLTIHEPSQDPSPDRECRVLEHHVQTASVVLAVSEDTTDTWIFGLHESPEDNSCIYDVEGAGSYTRKIRYQATHCQLISLTELL